MRKESSPTFVRLVQPHLTVLLAALLSTGILWFMIGCGTNPTGTLAATVPTQSADPRLLLFQQVTVAGLGTGASFANGYVSNINVGNEVSIANSVGSPLMIGSSDVCDPAVLFNCSWTFYAFGLPVGASGLSMSYKSGDYTNFAADLESITAGNVIIDSLDLEPVNNAYAVASVTTTQAAGFDCRFQVVPPSQAQTTASQDGVASRIITAASFDADGNVNLVSYGWTSDTATIYETQFAIVMAQDVASTATGLAAKGYIISAFGGDDPNGYILVGTRIEGNDSPRAMYVYSPTSSTLSGVPNSLYFTPVVRLTSPLNHVSISITEQ